MFKFNFLDSEGYDRFTTVLILKEIFLDISVNYILSRYLDVIFVDMIYYRVYSGDNRRYY